MADNLAEETYAKDKSKESKEKSGSTESLATLEAKEKIQRLIQSNPDILQIANLIFKDTDSQTYHVWLNCRPLVQPFA